MATGTEQRIAELAAGQHGVITRAQLAAAGLTPGMIRTWLSSGRLVAIHRGVYLLGGFVGSLEPRFAREQAAVLGCGAGAAVSHRSVAWMHEILVPPPDRKRRPVEVTLPGDVRRRRPGIIAYRTARLEPDDVTSMEGIPVVAPARTLRDLSTLLGRRDLERAAARALRQQLVTDDELAALLDAHVGLPGAPLLRAALARAGGPAFTRSGAEDLLLEIIDSADLPSPQANVVVLGYEVDFLWPDLLVIVEVDGYRHHSSPRALDRDHRRDTRLSSAGYQVLRFGLPQLVEERDASIAQLTAVLTLARARREKIG